MSRLARNPVPVLDGVDVTINGQDVIVKGPKGEMKITLIKQLSAEKTETGILVGTDSEKPFHQNMKGTVWSLISGMIRGVKEGFEKKLEINGVGYRAQIRGKDLVMQLGYSHEIVYPQPEGVKIECPTPTEIVISGVDKQQVGQTASEIVKFRPPEPYKGKGIKYAGQQILRKEGKKK
jgi:large subunit ribosomal protein L6